MLTDHLAFEGDTVSDLIVAILEREPDFMRLPVSTPANIRRLLKRCFEKDVRRRLRDIADARAELEEALSPSSACFRGPREAGVANAVGRAATGGSRLARSSSRGLHSPPARSLRDRWAHPHLRSSIASSVSCRPRPTSSARSFLLTANGSPTCRTHADQPSVGQVHRRGRPRQSHRDGEHRRAGERRHRRAGCIAGRNPDRAHGTGEG